MNTEVTRENLEEGRKYRLIKESHSFAKGTIVNYEEESSRYAGFFKRSDGEPDKHGSYKKRCIVLSRLEPVAILDEIKFGQKVEVIGNHHRDDEHTVDLGTIAYVHNIGHERFNLKTKEDGKDYIWGSWMLPEDVKILEEEPVPTIEELEPGQKVKVVGNSTRHGVELGTIAIVGLVDSRSIHLDDLKGNFIYSSWMKPRDVMILEEPQKEELPFGPGDKVKDKDNGKIVEVYRMQPVYREGTRNSFVEPEKGFTHIDPEDGFEFWARIEKFEKVPAVEEGGISPSPTTKDRKIIAVDFDGTLVENEYPGIGAHNWNVIEALEAEIENGAYVIIWTCRSGAELAEMQEWLDDMAQNLNIFRYDRINSNAPWILEDWKVDNRKIYADEYWDDKSVNVVDEYWDDEAVCVVDEFTAPKEKETKKKEEEAKEIQVGDIVRVVDTAHHNFPVGLLVKVKKQWSSSGDYECKGYCPENDAIFEQVLFPYQIEKLKETTRVVKITGNTKYNHNLPIGSFITVVDDVGLDSELFGICKDTGRARYQTVNSLDFKVIDNNNNNNKKEDEEALTLDDIQLGTTLRVTKDLNSSVVDGDIVEVIALDKEDEGLPLRVENAVGFVGWTNLGYVERMN